jgi:hypothetical protein
MPLLGVPGLRQLPGLLQVPNGPPGRAQRVFLLLPSAEVHSPSLLADQVRSPVLFCCCPILLPALLSCFDVFTTLNAVLLTHPSTGGSAWPSAWTSNSAYASALSSWQTQTTGAPAPFGAWGPGSNNSNSGPGGRGGWNGGNGVGPFGAGGPGNGWGPWSSRTSGDWTAPGLAGGEAAIAPAAPGRVGPATALRLLGLRGADAQPALPLRLSSPQLSPPARLLASRPARATASVSPPPPWTLLRLLPAAVLAVKVPALGPLPWLALLLLLSVSSAPPSCSDVSMLG